MSVAMTNYGAFGWISDLAGYRYARTDPETGRFRWPVMPEGFARRFLWGGAVHALAPFTIRRSAAPK